MKKMVFAVALFVLCLGLVLGVTTGCLGDDDDDDSATVDDTDDDDADDDASSQGSLPDDDGQPAEGGEPPQEAIDACDGKAEGDDCEVDLPEGLLSGTCLMIESVLACVPEGGQGSEPVSCDEVDEGMPCCGDGICDGPETADNCSEDC